MECSYEIQPRPEDLGGGRSLKLIEDGQAAGGGVFPVKEDAAHEGMEWWNAGPEARRAHWLMMVAFAMPAAARHAPSCRSIQRCFR